MSDIKRTIHIEIPAEATGREANRFDLSVTNFILDARWGDWDPIIYVHPGACEESDHCYGPGSNAEAAILARDALSQDEPEYEYGLQSEVTGTLSATRVDSRQEAEALLHPRWKVVRRPKQQPWEDVEA